MFPFEEIPPKPDTLGEMTLLAKGFRWVFHLCALISSSTEAGQDFRK